MVRMPSPIIGLAVLATATLIAPPPAEAADETLSTIGADSFKDASGVTAVIVGSGDHNIIFNGAAIAAAESDGFAGALASVTATQNLEGPVGAGPDSATASIEAGAFAGVRGIVMVGNVSGDGNLIANATAIVLGSEGVRVADALLSQTRSDPTPPADGGSGFSGAAPIHDSAFSGGSGVAQVINAAGSRNTLSNTLGLSIAE